jgi:YD repeat-containing protein
MTYTYSGGYYHISDHDFRGFNHVMVSGPTGPNGEQIITETWFHQGNDTAVLDENATVETLKSLASVTPGYMKGKPYRTKVKNGQGTVLSETTTTYKDDTSIPYFNPAQEVKSYIYGSTTVHTKTALTYDAYGNVTKEEQYGDVSITTDDRTIERSYAINETPWIVGLLKNETVYAGIGATAQVSSTDYYFDNAADCNAQSFNQVPTKGNVTRIERWLNGGANPEVRMAYDDYGNLKCTRDARGNIATITYDSTNAFPLVATNPLGHQTIIQYYGVGGVLADKGLYGQVKSVKDPNNMVTTSEYDPFGRKTKVIAADGTWASWAYNNFGTINTQHIRTDSSAGIWSTTYFDGLGRTYLAKKSGPAGKVIATQTQYNATGTVHRSSLPYFDGTETPRWTHYTYDDLGRATEVLNEYDNPPTSVKACYDVLVTTGLDAEGHKKRQTKDALGRLVKVEEFDGTFASCSTNDAPYAETTYEYDVMGNLRYVHDARGNTTEMRYNSLGQKYYMSDPDMGVWQYTYNANGSLESQTDAKGQTITFSYDALNRVKTKLYPDNSQVTYTYDVTPGGPETSYPIGRLSTMSDATGTTKYFYDNMGRATVTKKSIDGTEYTAVTGYEPATGRLQNIKYPGDTQPSVWYSYDGGYLSAVRSSQSGTVPAYVTYTNYTALGQPKNVTNGNGVTTTYTYRDDNSRLYSIVTKTGGQNLLNLSYTYWKDGNIKSIMDGVNSTRSYSQINYDGLSRLKEVLNSGPTLTYVYDEIGNFLSKEGIGYTQYGLNAGPHAVTMTSDGKIYRYDLNGNMVSDGTRIIAYNYDNMPVSVTVSGATSTFVYDGAGARVMKISPSGATAYIGKLQECRAGV